MESSSGKARHAFISLSICAVLIGSSHGLGLAASTQPNDPLATQQWGLQKIRALQAWAQPSGTGAGIKVAVVDSGVDLQHPDLQCPGKIEIAADADIPGDGEGPDDNNGHGTHVAGVIGACANNSEGIAGVAPDATLLPYQVLDRSGRGSFRDIATAIKGATDAGAHVINLALGPNLATDRSAALYATTYVRGTYPYVDEAIAYAARNGVVLVAAAGNNALPLCQYPALAREVVCAGATDSRDLKAWYSHFLIHSDGTPIGPSLAAPGGSGTKLCDLATETVVSLFPVEKDFCLTDGRPGYAGLDGTSMAAAHVSGAAAIVYGRLGTERTFANRTAVIEALQSTATDVGPVGYDPVFGHGRIDAGAAVTAVASNTVPPLTPTGLIGYPVDAFQIDLEWTDPTPSPRSTESFTIERREMSQQVWSPIATIPSDTWKNWMVYSDSTARMNVAYEYRVRANNSSGSSPAALVQVTGTDRALGPFPAEVSASGEARKDNLFIHGLCHASAKYHGSTRISECRLEDRKFGLETLPVRPQAGGHTNAIHISAPLEEGEPYWSENVWICWRASVESNYAVVQTSGCRQVY